MGAGYARSLGFMFLNSEIGFYEKVCGKAASWQLFAKSLIADAKKRKKAFSNCYLKNQINLYKSRKISVLT